MKRRGASFRIKLAAGMFVVALGAVAAVGWRITERNVERLGNDLLHRGDLYVQLLKHQLQPVVAFDDRITARDVFRSIVIDEDIAGVAVYAADGRLIEGTGLVPPSLDEAPANQHAHIERVLSREGPTGWAYVALGTTRLDHDRRAQITTALTVAAVVACLAFALAYLFSLTVTRRIERISAAASRVADGDLSRTHIVPGADDEIGALATAFNSMVADLDLLFEENQRMAASENERLTELVAARTAELGESREQYRLIAESTSAIPFTYLSGADRFAYVGPQAARVLGYDTRAWSAPGFLATVVDPSHIDELMTRLGDTMPTGFETELAVVAHGGQVKRLRMVAAPGVTGSEPCVRGLLLDVTDQRRVERELAHAQKLESVGRLAAGIAHEINTPVQFSADNVEFVRGAIVDLGAVIEALRRVHRLARASGPELAVAVDEAERIADAKDLDYLFAEIPAAIDGAREGLTRVATIVRAMREFAHPEEAGAVTAVALNQAIQSTLTVARNEYKYVADLELELGELPPVYCNLGEINQVVLNVVVNAAHAIADLTEGTDDRGRITVSTRHAGDHVVIAIADTGGGIPLEVRDRIFDPFFTTKDVGRGTGQGLAIARSIVVDKHGGSLTFESTVGSGTTFYIRLPVEAAAAAA